MTRLKFKAQTKSAFFPTVRLKVDNYFKEHDISPNANSNMWFKVIFFLGTFLLLYNLIITSSFNSWILLLLTVLLGMFSAFIGFNICHDAIHDSLSSNKKVNKGFSFLFNLVGANPYLWSIMHNTVHHTFTNIPGHDEDLVVAPGLIRISQEEPVNKIQRFQHLYAFPLYSLASLSWVFRKDYKKFFQSKIGEIRIKHPKIEYFNLFFFKGLYYFLFIVLPLLLLNLTWWQFLIGFMALHITKGLTMGLVFQLAHVVEGTDFPKPNEEGNIEDNWAEHQLRTTANFASGNSIAAFFLGGLNQQIEHHLFPRVCHVHYKKIGAIVKETAHEFNLPYIENPTFFDALKSHYEILKKLGKQEYRNKNKTISL